MMTLQLEMLTFIPHFCYRQQVIILPKSMLNNYLSIVNVLDAFQAHHMDVTYRLSVSTS